MVVKESAAEGEPRYSTVRMKLEGGQPWDHVSGLELTGGVSNYLRSSDVKDSITGIPHYGRLTVGGVYEGVDLVFYSHDGAFEYDFVVKPGRTLAITRGEVHAEQDGERRLVALMQQTLMVMHGRPDA